LEPDSLDVSSKAFHPIHPLYHPQQQLLQQLLQPQQQQQQF
jgi:hypothetical protein